MTTNFYIDPDIRQAHTLPASFYKDPAVFERIKTNIFLKSWQWLGDEQQVPVANSVAPFVLLPHFLNEPMVLSKDANEEIHCLSNVCTHRGFQVVQHPGKCRKLTCLYHGRRFKMDGSFEFMPEFKDAKDFPRPCDDLYRFPLEKWGPFLFAGLNPTFDLKPVFAKMEERIGFLPIETCILDTSRSKDYLVHAHWALYCDNYLEGFHIPFVHHDLNDVLDYGAYKTEVYDYCNLQIGYTEDAVEVFDFPEGHPDYGKNVGGYYYWVFPNMMFNFYPWGISVNIVKPIAPNRTRVSFLSYVYDEQKLGEGASADLDKVEREDEFVVEGVNQGIQSAFYKAGRFSPKMEQGVHHFHRLLAQYVNGE